MPNEHSPSPCILCGGAGYIESVREAGDERMCANCGGSGVSNGIRWPQYPDGFIERVAAVAQSMGWRRLPHAEKVEEEDMSDGLKLLAEGHDRIARRIFFAMHTFCEDCGEWTCTQVADGERLDGICRRMAFQTGPRGPLWPGCRGFRLREGAPGPEKRWREAVAAAAGDEKVKR